MKCTSLFFAFSQLIFSGWQSKTNWQLMTNKTLQNWASYNELIQKMLKWKLWWTSVLKILLVLQQLPTLRKFYFLLQTFKRTSFRFFHVSEKERKMKWKICEIQWRCNVLNFGAKIRWKNKKVSNSKNDSSGNFVFYLFVSPLVDISFKNFQSKCLSFRQ